MKISEKQEYIDMAGRRVRVEGKRMFGGVKVSGRKTGGVWLYFGHQIDRTGRSVGAERWWSWQGHSRSGAIEENIVRVADYGMSLSERQGVLLERMIQAVETDIALPDRVGPREFGSSMPDYYQTAKDIESAETWCINQRQSYQNRARWDGRNAVVRQQAICSSARIGRMTEAFAWLRAFVVDQELRRVLLAYSDCKARGLEWDRYIISRNRRHPTKKAWSKRTLYRWIEKALQQVDDGLVNNGVLLTDGAGLHVAHEAAKQAGKSITSGLHAWTPPEEIPALCG